MTCRESVAGHGYGFDGGGRRRMCQNNEANQQQQGKDSHPTAASMQATVARSLLISALGPGAP